uniref:Vir24 protein n=1 Tax=Plasmodium vivax TaxID=5855 RepID=Q9N886_PLAVI|nr:vir24 [Plasmodium vivax]
MAVPSEEDIAEQFLKKFPSYNIYQRLNKNEVTNKYDTYCKTIQKFFPLNQEIYQLCRMFARNLKEMSTILNDVNDNIDRCRYINFWKNYQIKKNHNTPNDIKNIRNIRLKFFSVASRINTESSIDECFYIIRTDISLDLWKKWKDLYDYITNKDEIQKIIDSDKYLCNIYSMYFSYITKIYEKYKEECCQETNGKCPPYINFSEWCTQGNVLTKLDCNHSEELPEPILEDSQDMGSTSRGSHEGVAETEARNGGSEHAELAKKEGELLDPVIDTGHSISEANEEPTNGNKTNPVGTIVGTSLGFIIPLITLYKFTPLGSWVNTKIFRKDRLMENMIRNERELLLNSSGIGETNFDNARYQIMYNSAHNE